MKKCLLLALSAIIAACGGSSGEPDNPAVVPAISLSTTSVTLDASGAASTVSLTSNVAWSATVSESWLGVSPNSGTGNATLTVTAQANTGASRTATVTIKDTDAKLSRSFTVTQAEVGATPIVATPDNFDGTKRSDMAYQLLVYSFADSDGDGIGDFKGIQNKLDYLDGLGVTALWLSPIHPSGSYHGYDVKDYYTVNPLFGTEADFKALVDAAHAKNIKIYIDYVLNHSGKSNAWFTEALASATSPYRNYYFFSSNPASDYSSFPMLKGTTYSSGEWKVATSGSPKITITKTEDAAVTGSSNWNLWFWKDGQEGQAIRFVQNGSDNPYLVMEISGKSGLLVRKNMNWDAGSKFGAQTENATITEGAAMNLVADGGNMYFTGNGRYRIELSDTDTETLYYMCAFDESMPDLNYGNVSDLQNNDCFKDLAASADKWIGLGIDGLRLDAVKHICGGINSFNNTSNQTFLDTWYKHCNATYKAAGHSDDIFMVGEVWSSHNEEMYYYKGINSCFEFGYWPVLYGALTKQSAYSYASSVISFISGHKAVRSDAITSIFMTNHDHSSQTGDGEVRAADDLGKSLVKEKQAAAMMLTTAGKPFVYQGEELGYWGNSKGKGDEYLRAPIVWNSSATDCAKAGVNNKVDASMLTGSISVQTQSEDENSLLNTYKYWARLRNTYPALATGEMKEHGTYNSSNTSNPTIACWYMTSGSDKLLVIHNTAGSAKTLTLTDDLSKPVGLLGEGSVRGGSLTLGANSSVVFKL